MKTKISMSVLAIAVLTACSSIPARNVALDQAREDYRSAQASPQVSGLAAAELKQAGDALERANAAWTREDETTSVNHLAYLTSQQIAVAREAGSQKAAEQVVAQAAVERDAARLAARTQEANTAERNAGIARAQADASLRKVEVMKGQVATERQNAAMAVQSAQDARAQADSAADRARLLETRLADLQAKQTDRGLVITLGDVLFDTDRAQLKPGGVRSVRKLADFFALYPQRNVLIEGFTDSTGSDQHNQGLSEQRARAVNDALTGMGVDATRIGMRGYGEAWPVADNTTASGRQLNRRVEVIVSDERGMVAPR